VTHYLRGNAECRVPEHHIAVHASSVALTAGDSRIEHHHRLEMGHAIRWRYRAGEPSRPVTLDFVTRPAFWEWVYGVCPKGCRVWVWCHDATRVYTILGLWAELDAGRLALKRPPVKVIKLPDGSEKEESCGPSIITAPSCFLADCRTRSGQSIRLIDCQNYAPRPLADLAQILGMPPIYEPGDAADDFDRLDHVRRCLDVVHRVAGRVCSFVRDHDLGNMQVTLGGQAMSHYRHRHLDTEITVGPEPTIRPLERDGYYGAKTQVYFRGHVRDAKFADLPLFGGATYSGRASCMGPVTRIDCNQCYPHVMRWHDYPRKLYRRLTAPTIRDLTAMLIHNVAVASVRLFSPHEPYPQKIDGKVSWKVGRVHTVLCGPELARALASGHVDSIDYAQVYLAGPLFRTWGEEVEAWRARAVERGDAFDLLLLKRMANSLHGKFAQRGIGWQTIPGEVSAQPWGEYTHRIAGDPRVFHRRGIAGSTQQMEHEDESAMSCPIISACVTSHARELVRACRLAAGLQQVVYEDADSLHVLPDGLERLHATGWIHPRRPGGFKVESIVESAEYRGPKHYRWGDVEVIPGHAFAGRYDARGGWSQSEWVGLDSLLSRAMPDAPIQIEREMGLVSPEGNESYTDSGWIVYRQGG
jgi:hypothetical protein